MSESNEPTTPQPAMTLQAWITLWPVVRREVEQRLEEHAKRDPSLYFEPALAQMELKDVDEVIRRLEALTRVLASDDLSAAEGEGTGNM
jgi:hypothetical protein